MAHELRERSQEVALLGAWADSKKQVKPVKPVKPVKYEKNRCLGAFTGFQDFSSPLAKAVKPVKLAKLPMEEALWRLPSARALTGSSPAGRLG